MFGQFRRVTGVVLKDLRRYQRALKSKDSLYLALCNRTERLEAAPDREGYRCDWQWTSDLHAPKVIPSLGLRLMNRALKDHPIVRVACPQNTTEQPDISFVIGHRGSDRLPHLLATLESIAGQQNASIECVVVEQDSETRITDHLPHWVKYVHTPPPDPNMPYCRSWAFNVGVKQTRAPVLVLHDNDMLIPTDYASNILIRIAQGYELINLKRFIFYLTEQHTNLLFSHQCELADWAPLSIVQNLEAGGSVAITRRAYDRIGGMDESFVGWGGEDNEFWERAQSVTTWPFAYLPVVHLWHVAQPGKNAADNNTQELYTELSRIPPGKRIDRLRNSPAGALFGPSGWTLNN